MIYTGWYDKQQIPVAAGVYQRDYSFPDRKDKSDADRIIGYAKYADGKWYCRCNNPDDAIKNITPSPNPRLPWRGIVQKLG